MPVFLVSFVARLVGAKLARPVIWIVLIGLLALGLVLAKRAYDRSVVEAARVEGNRKAVEEKAAADANAARARSEDEVRSAVEQAEIEEAVNEAMAEGRDHRAVYYECVRLQQAARAAGRPAPSC